MPSPLLTIVTPSYRNDFELAKDLSNSLDRHLAVPFKHVLVVPRSDIKMFSSLASAHRTVISAESILRPYGFFKLPFPKRIRIWGVMDRRIREQWYRRGVGRVSGWLIQQLIKLSAPDFTDSDLILFIDSDVLIFRPLELQRLYDGNLLKLSRKPMRPDMHDHLQWHQNALDILGVADFAGERFNYIGNLIAWRRQHIIDLQQRIARISGSQWQLTLARKKAVSEYILYGLYVETLASEHGHTPDPTGLTCSFWTSDINLLSSAMAKSIMPDHVALHIQSTIPMAIEKRRRIVQELIGLSE